MKTYAEAKKPVPSSTHAAPVPDALAHQAQLRGALLRAGVRPRLEVGAFNDPLEREADAVAERVMRMPESEAKPPAAASAYLSAQGNTVQAKSSAAPASPVSPQMESSLNSLTSGGTPLDGASRAFFEPRFGLDFSGVRLHTDAAAAEMTGALSARAFTLGSDIAFAPSQYSAHTTGGRSLLAHELAHVVQQRGERGQMLTIQRKLEIRPPGKGEASAYDRRQEFVDRLNRQSEALVFSLSEEEGAKTALIKYEVTEGATLTMFDKKMQEFIDSTKLVPMRLITHEGRGVFSTVVATEEGSLLLGGFMPILVDGWRSAYVDLDDLLAGDDASFRSSIVHFLTERIETSNYAHRIGTLDDDRPEFNDVHSLGNKAEAELLQYFFSDPSITFNGEANSPYLEKIFISKARGYKVILEFPPDAGRKTIAVGRMYVKTRDRPEVSMYDFRAERLNERKRIKSLVNNEVFWKELRESLLEKARQAAAIWP